MALIRTALLITVLSTIAVVGLAQSSSAAPAGPVTALIGGTVVDVRNAGESDLDLHDAVVLIQGDRILGVGPRRTTAIPHGARRIDISGSYVLPGLVDGFAGINSQGQANATLFMGVTTIAGSGDDRRGKLKLDANPSPHIYPIDSAGTQDDYSLLMDVPEWTSKLKEGEETLELTPEDTDRQLIATAKRGTRAIWVGHNLTTENVRRIIQKCRQLGLVSYGEFVATRYADGIADGVDVLLHMSRYELGLVPESLVAPLTLVPDQRGSDAAAYQYIFDLAPDDPSIVAYATRIRQSRAALMPTFSLEYLELPGHRNLWREPAASLLNPDDLHLPPDQTTGEQVFPTQKMHDRIFAESGRLFEINQTMFRAHPAYLAASGASAVGTMPGISMHTELELLVRLGMTPRQALAAATSNYASRFGWTELGLIEAGRRADILLLSADPTVDIDNSRKISGVMLSGSMLDRAALLHDRR